MNVLENVLIGFNKQMKYNIFEAFLHLGRFGKIEQVFKEKAYAILEELGIAEFAKEKLRLQEQWLLNQDYYCLMSQPLG